jgi:enterochelin esterase-like enzyme
MALALARHVRAEPAGVGERTRRQAATPPLPRTPPASPSIRPVNDGELTWLELPLARERGLARRALVLYPTGGAPGQTYPGLLLFHGRGETTSEQIGIHAWRSRYGLERSVERLRRPPLELDPDERQFMGADQLARLNATLLEKPFSGLVVICPYTPNARRNRKPERVLERYSEWVEHTLLPAAQSHAPLDATRGIGVDGCSLGGYMAAEVFVRKPHLFRTFGVVQPAVGENRVARYAGHLARAQAQHGLRAIHLQTSTRDPYRKAVKALARHLERQGARFTLEVLPGPHDQRWLRASGTLAMLAWHDYILG